MKEVSSKLKREKDPAGGQKQQQQLHCQMLLSAEHKAIVSRSPQKSKVDDDDDILLGKSISS